VLFPLVDPIIYTPWNSATQGFLCLLSNDSHLSSCSDTADTGLTALPLPNLLAQIQTNIADQSEPVVIQPASQSFKDAVVKCVSVGDVTSLAMHLAASSFIGPTWEEVSS
jgi:hypothetical protein